jgi:hypothetical protein
MAGWCLASVCLGGAVGCGGLPETGSQVQTSAEESQRQKLGILDAMKKGAYGKGAMGGPPGAKASPSKK